MTIIHISTAKSWRGGEQQIAYLLQELQNKGMNQWVICPKNSRLAAFCIQHQIPHTLFKKNGGFDPILAFKVTKLCRQFAKPIIHAHDSHAHTSAVLAGTIWMNKAPIVLHRRVSFKISNNPLSRFKYTYHQIKRILCVSQSVKQTIDSQINRPGITKVIYSAIDLKKFENIPNQNFLRQQYDIEPKCQIIGNISALTKEKDLYTFIDTAEILLKKHTDLYFFIIGDGEEKRHLQEYIKNKKLDKRVILTGFLPNPYHFLPELDLFLFTSMYEGLGTSILDAMASKVAVVATHTGGIPEIVKHYETGLCVEPQNAEKLAESVNELFTHKALKERLIQNAWMMLQDFSIAVMCEKTIEEYTNIS